MNTPEIAARIAASRAQFEAGTKNGLWPETDLNDTDLDS